MIKKKRLRDTVAVIVAIEDLSKLKAKKPKLHRPKVPDSTRIAIALYQGIACGCGCGELVFTENAHIEHDPPLSHRHYDAKTRKYEPDANDRRYLKYWRDDHHDKKTHGPGGDRRITTKGGDNHTAQHTAKKSKSHAEHLARMREKTFGKGY